MAKVYQPRRHSLRPQSTVDMSDLLAAREDVCNVVKTSSGSSREKTVCAVNKVQESFFVYKSADEVFGVYLSFFYFIYLQFGFSVPPTGFDGSSSRQRWTSLRDSSATS